MSPYDLLILTHYTSTHWKQNIGFSFNQSLNDFSRWLLHQWVVLIVFIMGWLQRNWTGCCCCELPSPTPSSSTLCLFSFFLQVSLVGFLFLLGLYISSLASCMGGLYGAPRILQCIAEERVIPALAFLGKGVGGWMDGWMDSRHGRDIWTCADSMQKKILASHCDVKCRWFSKGVC